MGKFIIRRILIAIPILLIITMIIFLLANLMPGDPVGAMLAGETGFDRQVMEHMRANLGLNDPLPLRYGKWLVQLLRGNFGYSYITFESVSSMIVQRIGPTLLLMGTSLFLSVIIGVALGIVSAIKQYSALDYIFTVLVFIGRSVPVFFVGMLFIYTFALVYPIFPVGGLAAIGGTGGIGDRIMHLALPALSLSVLRIAEFLRYSRASMLEILHSDFMWTARSKGIKETWVIVRHALRNALIPIITLLGLNIPVLFSGAIVIEQVFQWPGLGTLYNTAVTQRDYPLLMGLCFVSSVIVLVSNLLTDLAYAAVDPRIRYQ
jgi:peptide/nickel transport system permease protein